MSALSPLSGLSDKRYFHIALITPRDGKLSVRWIWNSLDKACKIIDGRYGEKPGRFDFKRVVEKPDYAGSESARKLLATSRLAKHCAYDLFVGSIGDVFLLGTGYAALTRDLMKRLVAQELLQRAWFLIPEVDEIVRHCRKSNKPNLTMNLTITGFSAFVPSVKNLRTIRLGGSDVFGTGLVDEIEVWLSTRGAIPAPSIQSTREIAPGLRYQAIRLQSTENMSGTGVSLSLASDGSCKMWLRQNAMNLSAFGETLTTLRKLHQFKTSATPPSWSEDSEP